MDALCEEVVLEADLTRHGRVGAVSMGDILGAGTFGIVFKGYHHGLKQVVAVKSVDLSKFKKANRKKQRQKLDREIGIMQKCNHKNIVKLIDFLHDGDSKVLLVVPFCGGGDLYEFMENRKWPMEEEDAHRFAKQIADGLLYLHSQSPPIIHRDLKPQNILMSRKHKKATIFIADFGEARLKEQVVGKTMLRTLAGTAPYMAPEILSATESVDTDLQYGSCGIYIFSLSLYIASVHCDL